jgi:hypothetical protein
MAPRKKSKPAKPSEVLTMIPAPQLNAILALDKRTKTAQAELAGELGQKISGACERYGTNKKALGVIRSLNRMEPEKLADFLDHFDYMLEASGLEKRAEAVQRLPLAEPEKETDDKTEAETPPVDETKVSRPQFGARAAVAAE